jgi:HSP20 family molecular chaperone IbpA
MPQIAITKVNDSEKKTLPVFGEIAKRLQGVQRRVFDLFEKRGGELGHELEDWFKAEHELFGWPAAELTEKDGSYELEMTLPGFELKDVEVTATPNEVIVHAATEKESKTKKDNVLWTEFGSNDVYRLFDVLNAINVDQVTAKLDNGVLKVNAPKIAKSKEVELAAA